MAVFQKIVESAQLFSLPDIYFKLKDLIEEPDYTMAEVAILVGRDPAMSARFLRFVNSPLNRRTCRIETVSHAVSLLGIRQVHDIVLGASVAEAFDGIRNNVMNMKMFWQQSFYCAVMTQQLALACDMIDSDRLFLAGLLHDIGHLFMYIAIPEESQQILSRAEKSQQPLYRVERETLGFDYAALGAHMMKLWGLPESLRESACHHPAPEKADRFKEETSLLHLGALLTRSDLHDGEFGQAPFNVEPSAFDTTGLTIERCLEERQVASGQYGEVLNSLFPGGG